MDVFSQILIKGIPILLAITLHEAAHGYIAYQFGDDTAMRAGRITLNPFRHIDLFGTILLPGVLLLSGAPFLFGYAKPVPVNFYRLRKPRLHSIWVAAAGPGMNILLAICSALLFHFLFIFPTPIYSFLGQLLIASMVINVTLAVFNMLPIPPLDGGRVAVGLLPPLLAEPLARLEAFGIFIILGLLIIPQFLGIHFNVIFWIIEIPIKMILNILILFAGIQ